MEPQKPPEPQKPHVEPQKPLELYIKTIQPSEPCIESQDPLDVENESWWSKLELMLSTFYIAY